MRLFPHYLPWFYAGFCVLVVSLYLGISLHFSEKIGSWEVYSSRGRLFMGSSSLRSMRVVSTPVEFLFSWYSPIRLKLDGSIKKRVLPKNYGVEAEHVSLELPYGMNLDFSTNSDVVKISTTIEAKQEVHLPWKIGTGYRLDNQGTNAYLIDANTGDILYEVISSSALVQVEKRGLTFMGSNTISIRPYRVERLSFDEWINTAPSKNEQSYNQSKERYIEHVFAHLTKKVNADPQLVTPDEMTALAVLSLASGTTDTYRQIQPLLSQDQNRPFGLSLLENLNSSQALVEYQKSVESLKKKISAASRENDRKIFSEYNLASFLVNHRFSVAHQRLVQLASRSLDSLDNVTLTNQLDFLVGSYMIRQTDVKAKMISKHLDVILPSLVFAYHGLYMPTKRMDDISCDVLSNIKLANILVRLNAFGFTFGQYAEYYDVIGYKIFETIFNNYMNKERLSQTLTLGESLEFSPDDLSTVQLTRLILPSLWPREFSESGELARDYYVYAMVPSLSIKSGSSTISLDVATTEGLEQTIVVFGFLGVTNVSGQKVLQESKTRSYGINEWYFDENQGILYIRIQGTGDVEKLLISSSRAAASTSALPINPAPTKPSPPASPVGGSTAPPVEAKVPKTEAVNEGEKAESKELSAKEKRELEKKQKELEKKKEKEAKRESEKK